MKAAMFYKAGDVRIEDVPAPSTDLAPTEVLVRNSEWGICGTDLHEYSHGPVQTSATPHPQSGSSLPQILGHEYAGDVLAVGADVKRAKVGDRVAIMPQVFCGQCEQCMSGYQQRCSRVAVIGLHWPWGGFGEYSVVGEAQVAALPESLTDTAGALVEPAAVAVHAVAPVRPGDTVLVTGGGPIGQLVALAAMAVGAGMVLLSEPHSERRRHAESLGISGTIDPRRRSVPEAVADAADGFGADVCVECSGSQQALDGGLGSLRRGGTLVQTALYLHPVQIDADALVMRDIAVKGSYCYPVTSWPRVISMIESGRLPVERIITGRIALDELVSHGFEALLAHRDRT